MRKLIIIFLLSFTYINTYAQYDETYSNNWGGWESASDFDGIMFRIKSNYVKGQKFKFVDIQFKNNYETGVYFHFFSKDLLGSEKKITDKVHWKTMRLKKSEINESNSVRLNFDDETLDIFIGGVFFSETIHSESPGLKSKFSHTYPEINKDFGDKDLCLYCSLFDENKLWCPEGKASDMSDPWSAYGSATLGPKISREQTNVKKAELEKFAQTPNGQKVVAGAAVGVLAKSLIGLAKENKRTNIEDDQKKRDNPTLYGLNDYNVEKAIKKEKRGRRLRTIAFTSVMTICTGILLYPTLSAP